MKTGKLFSVAFMDHIFHFSLFQHSDLTLHDLNSQNKQPSHCHFGRWIAFSVLWRHLKACVVNFLQHI